MKNLFKKICSLAIGLAILLPTPVFAQTQEYNAAELTQKYSVYVERGRISDEDLQQYSRLIQRGILSEADFKAVLAESSVAEVRIYSDNGSGSSSSDVSTGNVGHSFVTIRNVRRTNITVGRITLAPGEMVSVGAYGNLSTYNGSHKGVFYNVESSRRLRSGYYSSAVSLSTYVTASELSDISSYITKRENSYNAVTFNCTHLALGIWERTGGVRMTTGSPSGLYELIKKQSSHVENCTEMDRYGSEDMYYWNGEKLVNVVDKRN